DLAGQGKSGQRGHLARAGDPEGRGRRAAHRHAGGPEGRGPARRRPGGGRRRLDPWRPAVEPGRVPGLDGVGAGRGIRPRNRRRGERSQVGQDEREWRPRPEPERRLTERREAGSLTERKTTYLTTAIDYANGPPHMGHALEKIGADAMARYRRLKGEDVRLVIGMDEHGLNVLQSATAAGISPQQWVDNLADRFRDTWKRLGISNDDFIRTTEPRHKRAVEALIERIAAAGDLYRGTYAGYYCVGCESYKGEDELVPVAEADAGSAGSAGTATAGAAQAGQREVHHLRCPLHPTRTLLWMEESNWFFRLSRFQEPLLRLLDERPEFIQPEIRRNEIRRVIEGGLEDISVSRARRPWGVPWPGDPEHTVYVWIDALTNYLSAVGFPDPDYTRWWPAELH